jgi:predicted acylesterase/phospholipase RssA
MTIKHLVIPGGGHLGFKALGALQHLEQNGFWNINNIETIYATSAGAIISVLLCLKFDWETINDYIIKRPWDEVFQIGISQMFKAYSKKGLFDKNFVEIFYKPFFDAKDISLEITLKEFYDFSKIEIHLFTVDINNFILTDVSYISHPDLQLLTAVQMSSAVPILISPVCIDNKCYVDGGVMCNYPINQCILRSENKNEIFGIRHNYDYSINDNNIVKDQTNILEYAMNFVSGLITNISLNNKEKTVPNELMYDADLMCLSKFKAALHSKKNRKNLLDSGIKSAEEFLQEREKNKVKVVEDEEPLLEVDAVVLDDCVQKLC